jgi:DNA-binding NtrC family response regulator
LRNVIERALIVTRGPMISTADLPEEITFDMPESLKPNPSAGFKPDNGHGHPALDVHVGMSLSAVKRELLLQTLKIYWWQ